MRHQVRTKFDPTRDFTARRRMTVSGVPCEPGELFDKSLLTERRLRIFFETRRLVYKDAPVGGAQMTEEEAASTQRGAHATRAAQNAKRHAAHFAKKDREDAKKRAAEAAKAPEPRKRNSPSKIEGLKDRPAAPAKPPAKEKAAKPAKAVQAKKKAPTAEGAAFRQKMEAARAEAAARRAAEAEKGTASAQPATTPPPPAPAGGEAKPLKTLKRGETVKDPEAISAARAAVTIPAGWETLEWNELSSLAAQLSDEPVKSKVQALQVIGKEIARRGSA